MCKILSRISKIAEAEGVKLASIEASIGASRGVLSKAVKNGTDISSKWIGLICENYPKYSSKWLLTGEGNMLNEYDEPQANAQFLGVAVPAIAEDTVPVRFFEPRPSATFREFCTGVNATPDTINILPEKGDRIDELSCIFTVSGESMAPQIQDKAKILCREVMPSRWHMIRHGVIAIVYDDRFVIKRVKKNYLETENYILLASDNPEYPDTEKAYLGNIRCLFEVCRVISQRVY